MIENLLNFLKDKDNLRVILAIAQDHLDELRNFNFSFLNPLFWFFLLVIFLLLSGGWGNKKAFSFCSIIAIVLLATTKLETALVDILAKTEIFDVTVVRLASLFVICLFIIYYFLIKSND